MRHQPIPTELFKENRARLRQLLPPHAMAVVNANDLLPTNADGTLRMVPNTDLFFLTGVEQEESVLVLFPDADDERQRELLFLRETSDLIAVWEGHKLTIEEARRVTGIQNVHWLKDFPALFHKLMCEADQVYLDANEHKRAQIVVTTREARFVREVQERYPLHTYRRLAPLMHRLRVTKSPIEVDLLRRACGITRDAFKRVCRFVQPGVWEHEVEAEFAHEFIRQRGTFAYNPIIASGGNACVLHYLDNDRQCRNGELLLLDVGAAYANYNSDLTRTVPVNGRFTRRQRQVYNAVLRVLRASIQGLVPGRKWSDWQNAAEEMIARECVDLGLLRPRDLRPTDGKITALKPYFMHGLGHPLGLDVHDVGYLTEPFAPGWIMTVEPGIYIREEGLAVRLENDVLITENGVVDLMADIPLEADAIEELMQRRGRKARR
ncbi:MAG TPA: Xaa-Pro aminopeptidase [Verrucomicrobiota bacterium]|nr:Xaa-Pro aminopeptidase [Verrucomicrobiota bacterium]HNU51660.1 Xaa-Pro aminopeptidase [Verrucomicrobiota bacterium]